LKSAYILLQDFFWMSVQAGFYSHDESLNTITKHKQMDVHVRSCTVTSAV